MNKFLIFLIVVIILLIILMVVFNNFDTVPHASNYASIETQMRKLWY